MGDQFSRAELAVIGLVLLAIVAGVAFGGALALGLI